MDVPVSDGWVVKTQRALKMFNSLCSFSLLLKVLVQKRNQTKDKIIELEKTSLQQWLC